MEISIYGVFCQDVSSFDNNIISFLIFSKIYVIENDNNGDENGNIGN